MQSVDFGGLSEEAYAQVEEQAYEAAIVPERWPDVLALVGRVSDTAGAALLCANERGSHFLVSPHLARTAQRFLDEGWSERNTRAGGVIAKGLVGESRFLTEVDYYDPGQVEIDPMVNELFRKEGFGWAAGFVLQLPHGDTVVINVEQWFERGPIQGAALDALNSLYPHLARAAMFAGRSAHEQVRNSIETLTALGLPAAALSPTGRVMLANDAFATSSHVWTTRGGEIIALHDRNADAQLKHSLATIKFAKAPRSIALRAVIGGAVSAVLQVVPIRRSAHDVFGGTCAIAVLSETKQQGMDATLVHSLFDLTPAEIAVAKGLTESKTLSQIAEHHGRSIATVRNQLKSAMSKTGCSRQVELVLLMQQLDRK